jgi:hypothetical protein
LLFRLFAWIGIVVFPQIATAQRVNFGEFDAAIVFAVDTSSSIDPHSADLQREGHATALTLPEVIAASGPGSNGCIAITYVEGASVGSLRTVLPMGQNL